MARPLRALKRAAARLQRRAQVPRGGGAPSAGGAQSQRMQALQGAEAARRIAWRMGTIQGVERGPGGRFISGSGPEVAPGGGGRGGFGGGFRQPRTAAVGAAGGPASAGGLAQAAVPGGTAGAVAVRTAGRPTVDTTGYLPGSIPSPTPEDPAAQRWTMPRAVRQNIERIVSRFQPAGGPDGFRDRAAAVSHLRNRARVRAKKLSPEQQETIRDFDTDEGTYNRIQDALKADAGTPVTPLRGVVMNRRTPGGGSQAKYLREGGDPENPDDYFDVPGKEIKHIDDAMAPLEDDLILNYTTGPQAFGVGPDDLDDIDTWVGRRTTISKGFRRAKAGSFTSINDMQAEGFDGPYVKVSLLAPKGTRAVIPGDGGKVILDRESAVRISNITTDPDGNKIVWGMVEPRREFTEAPIGTSRLPRGRDRERRMGSLVRPRTARRELTSAERQALEGLKAGHTPRSLRQLQREGVITAKERRALEEFDDTSIPRAPLRNLLSKIDSGTFDREDRGFRAEREAAARAEVATREGTAAKAVKKAAKVRKVAGKAARRGEAARRAEILEARAGRKPKETAQPGRMISFIDDGGRKRSGRIVSRDDDGLLTVSWRETPGPDGRPAETEPLVDSADPKYRISAAPRPRVTRTPRITTAEPREVQAGTDIPPRADHTIFEYDPDTGQLLRTGRVIKRERNQDVNVTWDDGELDTIPKNPATEGGPEWGTFRRFKFETAAQRRTRERTTPTTKQDLADRVVGIGPGLRDPEEQMSRQSDVGERVTPEGRRLPGSFRSSLRRLRTSPEGEALPEETRRKLLRVPEGDAEAAKEGRVGWTPAERRAVTDAARLQYVREAEEARERWRNAVDALEQGARRLQARREGPKKATKVTREAARKTLQDNAARAMSDPDGLVTDLRAAAPDARSGMLRLGGRRVQYENVLRAAGVTPQKSWSIPELTRQILRALGGEEEAPSPARAVKAATPGRKVTAPSAPEAPKPPVKAAKPTVKRATTAAEPGEVLPRLRAAETPEAQREILEAIHPRLKGDYQAIARDLDIPHDIRTTRKDLIDRIAQRLAGGETPAPTKVVKAATRTVKAPGAKAAPAKATEAAAPDEIDELLARGQARKAAGGRSLRRPRTPTDEQRAHERAVDELLQETRATNLTDPASRDAIREARSRLAAGDDAEDIVRRLDDAAADVVRRTVAQSDVDNPNLERLAREAGLPDDPDALRRMARESTALERAIEDETKLPPQQQGIPLPTEELRADEVSIGDVVQRADGTWGRVSAIRRPTIRGQRERPFHLVDRSGKVMVDSLLGDDQVVARRGTIFRDGLLVNATEATPNELRAAILGRRRHDAEFLRNLASRIRRETGIPEPVRKAVKKAAVKKVAAKAVKAAAPEAPTKAVKKAVKKAAPEPEAPAPVKKVVKAATKKAAPAAPEAPVKKAAPAVKKAAPAKTIAKGPAGLDLSEQEIADYRALPSSGDRTRYTLARKKRGFTHAEAIQYAGGPPASAAKKAAPAAPEAPVKKAVKRAVKAAEPEAPAAPVKKAVKRGADTEAPVDPFNVLSAADEAGLRQALDRVDIDGLRAVIRRNGMDIGRVSRSKDKQKLVDHIVALTKSRSTKGQAFRPPVKRAAPAKQVAEARQEAGDPSAFRPGRQATEALIPNERIRGSNVHEHGPVRHIMALSDDEKRWDIGDGKAFGNEVVRAISDEASGKLSAQELADRLASMRDRLPVNSRARQVLRAVLDEMGAHKPHPDDPRPHMSQDTPQFLRRLLDDFFDNPLTRDPKPFEQRGHDEYRSDFLRAIDLVARLDAGQIRPLAMEEELRKLDNTHHESVIGFYDQRRAVRRAIEAFKALTPDQKRSLFQRTPPTQAVGVGQPSVPRPTRIRVPRPGTAPGTSTPPAPLQQLKVKGWPTHPEFDVFRSGEDGALTGQLAGVVFADRLPIPDTGDIGIPVRNLRIGDNYEIYRGTAWRIDGVTYLAEHTSIGAPRARAWREDVRRHLASLPPETRHMVRGQVLLMGDSPNNARLQEATGRSDMQVSMETAGDTGVIITFQGGHQFEKSPPDFKDYQYDHEFAHILGVSTGTIHDEASPGYQRAVEADPVFRPGWDLDTDGSHITQQFAEALAAWDRRSQLHGKVKNGSTEYGRASWGESFSEDWALYRRGRIGEWTAPDGQKVPAFFRDIFPERAAYFDLFTPSIRDAQFAELARATAPTSVRGVARARPRGVARAPMPATQAAPAPGRTIRRGGPAGMTDAQREDYGQLQKPTAKSAYTRAVNKGADHEAAMTQARAVDARPIVTRAVPAKKAAPGEAPAKVAGRVVRRPGPAGMTDDERVDYDKLPNAASKAAYTNARKTMEHAEALERAQERAAGRPAVKRAGRRATPTSLDQGQRIQESMDRLADILSPNEDDEEIKRDSTDALLSEPESPDALKGVNLDRYLRWRRGEALTPGEETGLRNKLAQISKKRETAYERALSVEIIGPTQIRENIAREREIQRVENQLLGGDLTPEQEDSLIAELAQLRSRSRSAPGLGDPVNEHARLRDWLAADVEQTQRQLAREQLSPAERRKLEKHLTRTSRMLRQEAQRVGFGGDERVSNLETAQRRISDRVVAQARQARIDRYTEQGFPPASETQRDNAVAVLRAYGQRGIAQEVMDQDLPPRLARKQLRDAAKQQKRDAASLLEETARMQAEGSLRPNQLRDRIRQHQQMLRDAEIRTQLAKDITKSQQKSYKFRESALTGTQIERRVPAATASPGPNDVPEEDDVVYLGRRGYGRVLDVGPTTVDKNGRSRTPITVQRENATRLVEVDIQDLDLVRKGNWDLDQERLTKQLGRRYRDLADAEATRIDDAARTLFRDRIASARVGGELGTAAGRRLTRIVPLTGRPSEPRKVVRRGPEVPSIQPERPSEEATARRLAEVRREMEREPTRGETQEFERLIRAITGRPWSEIQNDPEALERLRADERIRSTDAWNIIQRANMARPVVGFGPTPPTGPSRRVRISVPEVPATPVKKVAKAAVKKAAPAKVARAAAELTPERRQRIEADGRSAATKLVQDIEENITKGASDQAIETLIANRLRRYRIREVDGRFIHKRAGSDIDLSSGARTTDPEIRALRLLAAVASDVDIDDREGTLTRLRKRAARVQGAPTAPVKKAAKAAVKAVKAPAKVAKAAPAKAAKAPARKVARAAPELTPKQIYDMKLPEARRVAREAFPDLPENASRGQIVDRFTPDRPRSASPETEAPETTRLRQLVEAGDLVEEREIGSNATARVARLRAPDGGRVVSKRTIPDPRYVEDADAESRTDAEYLVSRWGRAMDADVPNAFSPSARTVVMDHVPGTSATRLTPDELATLASTPAGRRLAILRIASGDTDGHPGNLVRTRDGRLVGIDFSGAFKTNLDRRVNREIAPAPMHQADPFRSGAVVSEFDERGVNLNTDTWADQVPFTAAELRAARRALQGMKPEFERLGRGDWYRAANARIGAMLKRATPAAPTEAPPVKKAVKRAAKAPSDPIENEIREAYARTQKLPGGGVKLADLRSELSDTISRRDIDTVLRRMGRGRGVSIMPNEDLKARTQADKDSALKIGEQDYDFLRIEGAPEAPPTKKAVKRAVKAAAPEALSNEPAVREVQIENRIRQAYQRLAAGPRDPFATGVRIADLRTAVGNDVAADDFDQAIRRMARMRGIAARPADSPRLQLTDRDLAGAVKTSGGGNLHFLEIDDASLRPLPAKKARVALRPALVEEAKAAGVKNVGKKNMERLRTSLTRRRTQPAETPAQTEAPPIVPGPPPARQVDLKKIAKDSEIGLPAEEIATWQRRLDAGEAPGAVAADIRRQADEEFEAFQVKHRDFLTNENVKGSREIDAERAHIANLTQLADRLEARGGELPGDPNAPGPPGRRPRVVRPSRDVTPEGESEEEEEKAPRPSRWQRILRRLTGKALDPDDEELGRPGGKKRRREKRISRLLGGPNGNAMGPEGLPRAPGGGGGGGGGGGAGGGADDAVEDIASTALRGLRGRTRSRDLPDANDFGDTSLPAELPTETRVAQVGPRLFPRPTSGIRGTRRSSQESGAGAIPAALRGLGPEMADVPISGSGSGPTRVGRQLSPDLEQLLDNLRYDNAESIAGQLRSADLEPGQINALSRRTGTAPSLVGLRGRNNRLNALAEALAQAGQQTPIRVTDAPAVSPVGAPRVIRRGRRAPVPLPDDANEDALEEMEERLANARRRVRRGGATGRSPAQVTSELEAEEAALVPAVQATRARINPSANFWRRREVAQALVDDGLTPVDARRATGTVPEQVPLATVSLPAEATGTRLRIRRPAAVEQPRTLDVPVGEPGLPMEAVFEPPRQGSIPGIPGDPILGPQDLNELGGDSVLAAYRAGRARSGPAASRLDDLAEEMEQGAGGLNQPDRAIQQAEARRLRNAANNIRNGTTVSGSDAPVAGQPGGGGLVPLSAADIRAVLSKLQTVDQARTYLQSLHFSPSGLKALGTSLGLPVRESMSSNEVLELIAGTVQK